MNAEQIRAIALEVANVSGGEDDYASSGFVKDFATRFVAAITEKQEPVAFMASSGKVITADDAEMMLKYSASYFHTPLYLHPSFEQRNPALLEIAIQVQYWLDYQERIYGLENTQLNDDSHLYAPPVWPTRGMLKNWVAALTNSQESPAVERCAAKPDTIQQEYQWVRDVLAEHGYDGPLAEACCPLREMLASHPEPAPQEVDVRKESKKECTHPVGAAPYQDAIQTAHAAGFAGTSWIMGPEELNHVLEVARGRMLPLPDDVKAIVEHLRFAVTRRAEYRRTMQEAADMLERLTGELQKVKDWNVLLADHNEQLAQRGDDLEERLARQVPEGCVVVPREPTEAMKKAAEAYRDKCLVTPGMQKTFGGYYRAMIAAGEVKP